MARCGIVVCAMASAAIMAVLGLLLCCFRFQLLAQLEREALAIVPGTPMFPNWKDLPVPVITSVYFFNVTNAEDIRQRGAKPHLVEVGPYAYKEVHNKTVMKLNGYNDTITYNQTRTWYFWPERSGRGLTEDDVIVTLNPPAATVNTLAEKANVAIRALINIGLGLMGEKLFVAKTVRELTFAGYKDPILTDTKALPDSLVPEKMDRFGYFYPRNGTDWFDGIYNMYTGREDLSRLGEVYSWNYTTQSPYFPGECGRIRGAAEFFPPNRDRTFVQLYNPDLCRTIKLDFARESKTKNGNVSGYVYEVTPEVFANSSVNPDNACFEGDSHHQLPGGVFNASACRFGAPIFMSQPHFFQADPFYLQQVGSGLSPNKADHGTEFLIEPQSGLPAEVVARFQVNFRLQPVPEVAIFRHLRPNTFFPTTWFESRVDLPPEMLNEIWLLSKIPTILLTVGLAVMGLSISTMISVAICYHSRTKKVPLHHDTNTPERGPILGQSLFAESAENDESANETGAD